MGLGRALILAPLAALLLGGCGSQTVAPSLVLSERSPDGLVEVYTDSTDPDEGTPEYRLAFAPTKSPKDKAPAHCLDSLGSAWTSFSYSSRYVGRHDYEITTDDAPPCREEVRLPNGLVVVVTVIPNGPRAETGERVVNTAEEARGR